jgi:hypothetical protein
MLDSHSQISIMPETHFTERVYRRNYRRHISSPDDFAQSVLKGLRKSNEFEVLGISEEEIVDVAKSCCPDWVACFREIVRRRAELCKAQWCGEKSPQHIYYLHMLRELMPEMRCIIIVRDPRAVGNSLYRILHAKREQSDWPRSVIQPWTELWRHNLLATLMIQQSHPEQFHVLTYEDLIAKPEATLQKICNFLKLSFELGMLDYLGGTTYQPHLKSFWKDNNRTPLRQDNANQWTGQIRLFHRVASELLAYPLLNEAPVKAIVPDRLAKVWMFLLFPFRITFYFLAIQFWKCPGTPEKFNDILKAEIRLLRAILDDRSPSLRLWKNGS